MPLGPFCKITLSAQKKDVFGWLCISNYPNAFLRRWGGWLAIPQCRWGPLGSHNTTAFNFFQIPTHLHFSLNYVCMRVVNVDGSFRQIQFKLTVLNPASRLHLLAKHLLVTTSTNITMTTCGQPRRKKAVIVSHSIFTPFHIQVNQQREKVCFG